MDLAKFTKEGKFLMLALDHRESIKKLMNPDSPEQVTGEQVIALKGDIINSLMDQFSGLLVDEVYGLDAYPDYQKPFLLPVEKSGYSDQAGERITELEYTVGDLINFGASGAKLLIYFNPHLKSAKDQLGAARKVLQDCQANNFPFFLEIVTYNLENNTKAGLVIDSVRAFIEAGIIPDVWKLEYPGDIDACFEITNLVGETPWILLTGGATFEVFQEELVDASKAGAKGFLAGRALWQEVCTLEGEEKNHFLNSTLPDRFKAVADIIR